MGKDKFDETKLIGDGTYKDNLPAGLSGKFDLEANLEGVAPRLPQIKIMHQAQMFGFPNGDKEVEFVGVILDTNRVNAWWEIPYEDSGGGDIPDCFSHNGIDPTTGCGNKQAASCLGCAHNEFGTKGRGKACKNMKRVHIIMPGQSFPYRLTLPPTNLEAIDEYIRDLTSAGKPYQLVITKFGLKEKTNKEGVAFSYLTPEIAGYIENPEIVDEILARYHKYKSFMRGQEILFDEYEDKG